MQLQGKVCMITGGSGGIGAASALVLARGGAHIAAFGRSDEEVAALRDQVHSLGGKFRYGTGDVAEAETCRRMVDETVAELGAIDVLVHSAGGAAPGNLLSVDVEQWHRAFDVHIHSIFYLSRAAV